VSFAPEQTLDAFVESWTRLPGIGDWTAQYIAMRALSHPDAFPAGDLILRRAASSDGKLLSEKALRALAEAWRPWRAYAVLHLWRSSASLPPGKTK
jgi:AraC family transcriptional regulator of adaptative response / DNA-3-methyladenine glycosylase II